MKTYFTADTHFEHAALLNQKHMRPFVDDEWDEMMLHQINSHVRRQDRLFILGDFAWKRPGYWRQKIRCRHVTLILGNHDNEPKCRNVFGGAFYRSRTIKLFDTRVFLSHYPAAYWDGSHKGWLHLYGHCHNQREETLNTIWPERRAMDVSPDTAFALLGEWRPFSDEEIYTILQVYEGHDPVDFYHDFQQHNQRGW